MTLLLLYFFARFASSRRVETYESAKLRIFLQLKAFSFEIVFFGKKQNMFCFVCIKLYICSVKDEILCPYTKR